MTRVDLAAMQKKLDADQTLDDGPDYQNVKAMVAELRAAREVVEGTRTLLGGLYWNEAQAKLVDAAIIAYDKAVGVRAELAHADETIESLNNNIAMAFDAGVMHGQVLQADREANGF